RPRAGPGRAGPGHAGPVRARKPRRSVTRQSRPGPTTIVTTQSPAAPPRGHPQPRNLATAAMHFLLALAAALTAAARAFNVDLQHAVVVRSPTGADDLLFGYSVALTPAQLLVGEPRAEWLGRPEILEPGALHRCRLDMLGLGLSQALSQPQCSDIRLDMAGNDMTYIGGHSVHHLKNNSMFASTIVTTSAGLALVCGPGWKNQLYREKHYLMNGLCYSLDWTNLYRQPKPYAPLVERERQGAVVPDEAWPGRTKNAFYYAFGEAGFSAHISQEAGEVLLGAPGVYSWRGSVVRYRINEAGQLVEKLVLRPDSFEDYGYFGYSVTAGGFDSSRRTAVQYAAGAPRAAQTGKVLLFELPDEAEATEPGGGTRMSVLQEVYGEQLGEYFGAAVLAEDVNGDGLADLLVGAPLHSTAQAGDQGRVYVHLNLGEGRLRRSEPPLGPWSRPQHHHRGRRPPPHDDPYPTPHGTRFGSALAAAGDVNKDGYNDVWVGAPYEDGGRGAVYLFLGSAAGLRTTAAQRVSARNVHADLRSFGFSLAASADVDDNGYTDLAVGAPLSGHAVVLLTRPAARLAPRITSSVTELSFSAASFVLSACLQYTGHRAQPHAGTHLAQPVTSPRLSPTCRSTPGLTMLLHRPAAAVVTLALDGPSGALERATLQLQPPAAAGRQPARQVQYSQPLQLGRLGCTNVTVLIRPNNVDFTTPIDVAMRFNLTDEASRKDRPFCRACPVLDPTAPTSASLRIPYATGCKNDSHCRPDLKVSAEWHDTALPLVVGGAREVTLRALVRNAGEPAFLARLAVTLPPPLAVARMPPACHAPRAALQSRTAAPAPARLLCDLANPLGHNKQLLLELPLDVSQLTLSAVASAAAPAVTVTLNATSAGAGAGGAGDGALALRLPLAAIVDLDVVGRASPELGLLPDHDSAKAVSFTHTFEVRHVGPTWAPGAALRLYVPVKAREGGPRGRIVTLLKLRVLVDRRRVNCTTREVTEDATAGREKEVGDKARGTPAPRPEPGDTREDPDDWDEDMADGAGGAAPAAGGLRCGVAPALCMELQCPLLLLPPAAVTVDLRLRLLTDSLDAVGVGLSAVAVHTKAMIVLTDLPSLPAGSKFRSRPAQLSTLFMRPAAPAPVQPWVVGLSVAAGLLLLALLTLALRKAGFFGRKKIPQQAGEGPSPEEQGIPGDRAPRPAGVEDDGTLLADERAAAAAAAASATDDDDDGAQETASDSGMSMHSSALQVGHALLHVGVQVRVVHERVPDQLLQHAGPLALQEAQLDDGRYGHVEQRAQLHAALVPPQQVVLRAERSGARLLADDGPERGVGRPQPLARAQLVRLLLRQGGAVRVRAVAPGAVQPQAARPTLRFPYLLDVLVDDVSVSCEAVRRTGPRRLLSVRSNMLTTLAEGPTAAPPAPPAPPGGPPAPAACLVPGSPAAAAAALLEPRAV
ncbi:Integrin alpha-PS3, partial [Frankliniella fusca]